MGYLIQPVDAHSTDEIALQKQDCKIYRLTPKNVSSGRVGTIYPTRFYLGLL